MQELFSNPYTYLFMGVVGGGILGYTIARFSLSSGGPTITTCSGDFTLAKSKIISPMRAKDMYDAYTRNRVGLIQSQEGAGFEPTRFGTMDFDILTNYVDYLQCVDSKMKSVGLSGIRSVRTYFANYPEQFRNGDPIPNASSAGVDYPYSGRNTYFMLPTMMDGDDEKGFKYTGDWSSPDFQSIEDFMHSSTGTARLSENGSLIMNEVGLTPPPPGEEGDF